MIDHLAHAATSTVALVTVAVVSTANAVVGAALGLTAFIFGAEVNDGVLATVALFVVATGTAIAGWALILLVKLSNVVSKLEVTADDHERRLTRVET